MSGVNEVSYWARVESVRMLNACDNKVQITPGIGNSRLIGYAACGQCSGCAQWLAANPEYKGYFTPNGNLLDPEESPFSKPFVKPNITFDAATIVSAMNAARGVVDGIRDLVSEKEPAKPAPERAPKVEKIREPTVYEVAAVGAKLLVSEEFLKRLTVELARRFENGE